MLWVPASRETINCLDVEVLPLRRVRDGTCDDGAMPASPRCRTLFVTTISSHSSRVPSPAAGCSLGRAVLKPVAICTFWDRSREANLRLTRRPSRPRVVIGMINLLLALLRRRRQQARAARRALYYPTRMPENFSPLDWGSGCLQIGPIALHDSTSTDFATAPPPVGGAQFKRQSTTYAPCFETPPTMYRKSATISDAFSDGEIRHSICHAVLAVGQLGGSRSDASACFLSTSHDRLS